MGFRRVPDDPLGGLAGDVLEASLRLLAAGGHQQPPGEETDFPAIDVFETPAELVIEAELPGIDPAAVGVSAADGRIVIEGHKPEEPGAGRVNYLCMERSFGAFRRVVPLGRAVDATRASAACRDGVLQVRIPKVEEKRGCSRVIPVRGAHSDERSQP
jgi:HSP20 family molecular chaperone IbpA